MDLFSHAAEKDAAALAPLAERMRPRSLEEFVGQYHLTGPGHLLRRAIEQDQVPSLILWGPPGTGKTTLARLIAETTRSDFVSLSAVLSGVKDIREVDRRRPGPLGRAPARGRSSSSTRSTASTRRSRTRSCPTSRRAP